MNITETCLPYKSQTFIVEKTTNLCCVMFVHVCGLCCDMFVHVCGFLLGRKSTYSLERKKAQSDVRIGGT